MIPSCERAGKEAHDDCCALADPVDGRKSVSSPVLLPCPTTVSTLRTLAHQVKVCSKVAMRFRARCREREGIACGGASEADWSLLKGGSKQEKKVSALCGKCAQGGGVSQFARGGVEGKRGCKPASSTSLRCLASWCLVR